MGIAIPQVITASRSSGAQVIDGSLQFDRSSLNYLRLAQTNPGNSRTWTSSFWVKQQPITTGSTQFNIISAGNGSSNRFESGFNNSNQFFALVVSSSTTVFSVSTDAVFRDIGWYHVVLVADTTNGTQADRFKIYINGNLQSLSGTLMPDSQETHVNGSVVHAIGNNSYHVDDNFSGLLSNVYLIDGQALGPEYFGFTDPLTNTWKPKKYENTTTSHGDATGVVGFGTCGFYFPFDGNSPIGQDQSGQGNNFTPRNFGGSVALDNPIVSGARPILNTSQGGTQATPGVFGSEQNVRYTVTVQDDGGGNKYYIDGVKQATLTGLIRGATYTFDTSDSSVSSHPFRFSETDGGSEYVDGVAAITGTATTITIPHDASNDLYYYCTSHPGMGSSITGITTNEKLADQYAWKCVLALPLVGVSSDVSASIGCTASTKAMSLNIGGSGINFSSAASNFYRGSFHWNNEDTYFHNTYTSEDFVFKDGSFTIEGWFKYDSKDQSGSSDSGFFQLSNSGTGSDTYGGAIYLKADGGSDRLYVNVAADSIFVTPTGSFKDINGKWRHIALVGDSGTSIRLYIDGISQTLSYSTGSGSYDISGSTRWCAIGKFGSASANEFGGYIQDFRVYSGVAKYNDDFVVPSTSPDIIPDTPSGVSGSSKLTKITDGAVAFDGTGDFLGLANSTDTNFGLSDFTIECFAYFNDVTGSHTLLGQWENSTNRRSWLLQVNNGQLSSFLSLDGTTSGMKRIDSELGAIGTDRWYHLAYTRSSNTMRMFIDGRQVGSVSVSGFTNYSNTNDGFQVGSQTAAGANLMNGFISNARIIKGTGLYTSNFTPSAPLTNVTNTKLLCCQSNTSATESAVTPGTITANGDAAAVTFSSSNTDINTVRGQETDYCTWNPLDKEDTTLSDGNLTALIAQGTDHVVRGTSSVETGKWFWEVQCITGTTGMIGISNVEKKITEGNYSSAEGGLYIYVASGSKYGKIGGSFNDVTYSSAISLGDIIGVALDMDNGDLYFYKNGSNLGKVNSTSLSGFTVAPALNEGGGGSFKTSTNFGQKPFKFPPPDGYQPLNNANTRPETIVSRPDQYVGVTTYTATNTSDITKSDLNHQPDFLWIKTISQSGSHTLTDSVRGVTWSFKTESSAVEEERTGANSKVKSFNHNGFTIGTNNDVNNTGSYVAWSWKAGGNKNTFNVDDVGYATAAAAGLDGGTITPTGASIGTKQGFSIIAYTGNGSNSTISHGLTKKPQFILAKNRDSTFYCPVYHAGMGYTKYADIQESLGYFQTNANYWTAEPTSSVFSIGTANALNKDTDKIISYLWHDVPGLQKFGIYEGNADTDGPYVELGFKPAILMLKNADAAEHWYVYDSERSSYNPAYQRLLWSSNAVEENSNVNARVDLLSSGFKLRQTNAPNTANTYIYAAWAESPAINLYGGGANAR